MVYSLVSKSTQNEIKKHILEMLNGILTDFNAIVKYEQSVLARSVQVCAIAKKYSVDWRGRIDLK